MRREINIIARGEEGPIELMSVYFDRCRREDMLPVEVKFGAIVVEHKGKKVARMLVKGIAEDNKTEGGEGMAGDNKQLNNAVAKAKEVGRYMLTITTLKPDGTMEHDFVMQNFPTGEMLNSSFEHERLVRREKVRLDHK